MDNIAAIDVVTTSTVDLGPLSIDSFRNGNLSASWAVDGVDASIAEKAASESNQKATDLKQVISQVKEGKLLYDDQSHDKQINTLRRPLNDPKLWILQFSPNTTYGGEKLIMRTLIPHASEKIQAMGKDLAKARDELYDCKLVSRKLRAMLKTSEEQVRRLKKQSIFLSQLGAKTLPNAIHCLSMLLTIEYYLLPPDKRHFTRSGNLENPNLYHYALFSDNVLAASVVVNSIIMNAKHPSRHIFHLVTDKLNIGAMYMWFMLNPPGKATINVENVDEFKWLNSSYCPVLRQLETAAMKEYYFKADHQPHLDLQT
ncbi:Polygalacturonate 4-alpha-galacturonosyltransferase [Hibiscus syriacus]|uniref:Hexosyltransferase n=1 Tax=Hibiscus syriacus TaxID=106335 RepID=A0A6A2WQY6_HIBSY|nr:Polygalacturonate 4-alpha-galacturonosyltransferase [Hibiscus syriacus]